MKSLKFLHLGILSLTLFCRPVHAEPVITNVFPHSGNVLGGMTVHVTGKGFSDTSAVNFGSTPASDFRVISDSALIVTTPCFSPAVGTVDIIVTDASGSSSFSSNNHYTFTNGNWFAYITNFSSNTVMPINVKTNKAGAPIMVQSNPDGIAITPDGRTAYIVNSGDNTVTPFDLETNTLGTSIHVGSDPFCIAITPDGTRAYVTNVVDNSVTPIDLQTRIPGQDIPVGVGPFSIAITPNGSMAYTANVTDSTVTPINLITNTPLPAIKVGMGPDSIAITPDGTKAYVTNSRDHTVTPIDLMTHTTGAAIPVGSIPISIAITPDGKRAFVANVNADSVTPIDLRTNTPGKAISVGMGPESIAITPDGKTAYVGNVKNNTVTPIDIETYKTRNSIRVGAQPSYIAITPDQAPISSFTVNVDHAGLPSFFDGSASATSVGAIVSYAWDFGDGHNEVSLYPTTSHTYSEPGAYTASLTVTNSAGTSTKQIFTGQTMSNNGGPIAQSTFLANITRLPVEEMLPPSHPCPSNEELTQEPTLNNDESPTPPSQPNNVAPQIPPQTPSEISEDDIDDSILPPTKFIGIITSNKFLTQTEYFLKTKWHASLSHNVAFYRIYRKDVVVGQIPADEPLVFITRISKKRSAREFSIAAVSADNVESEHVRIKIE